MKLIISSIFLSIILFACTQKEETKIQVNASLGIIKTEKSYEIYSNKGELILEFTKQYCYSSSLETLEYIYQTSKEFYNQLPAEKENEIQSIKQTKIYNESTIFLAFGIFINLVISRFGLAYQVSKFDCSLDFLKNPDAFYITNIIFFVLLLGLSFLINFPFWIVLICYMLSYLIGRKLFWMLLKNSYERLEKVALIRDDDGTSY